MGGGKSSSSVNNYSNVTPRQYNPGSFDQLLNVLPQDTAPIRDPSAILNAYMQQLPRFMSVREPVEEAPPVKLNTPASQRFNVKPQRSNTAT